MGYFEEAKRVKTNWTKAKKSYNYENRRTIKTYYMKYLSIIILIIHWNTSFSQNYLAINTEWTENSGVCGVGPYCTSQEYTIRLDADTIINNISYFKTKREGITTTWNWTVDTLVSVNPIDDYHYPLREEQGVFYYYIPSTMTEILLHDFNLSVGDTAIYNSPCTNPQVVMKIDTIFFGTQMRKRFLFELELNGASSPLYEGIGLSRGLFVRPCSGSIGIEFGSSLQCYTTGAETIQIDTSGQCETTIPVNTKEVINNEFKIYPNPFDDRIFIENKWHNSNELRMKLFDFQGSLVITKQISPSENLIEISTKDIKSGKYVLVIYEGNSIFSTKMIKIGN